MSRWPLRLVAASTTVLVMALGSLTWAQPAQAAPKGLCSIAEWQDPRNFARCAQGAGDAANRTVNCVNAPTPRPPGSGLVGWVTSRPQSDVRGGVSGPYTRYGVAGYQLELYDVSCAGGVTHPDANMENAAASFLFSVAAGTIGVANVLREYAYSPGLMWGWSDGFVNDVTSTIYHYVFTPGGLISLMLVGLWLIWRARSGSMSEVTKIVGTAVFVMVAVTAVSKWPVQAAHGFDTVAGGGLTVVHSVLGPGPQDVPADRCPVAPNGCKDFRTVAGRSSDAAVDAILYRNWLRAVLGSSTSPTAVKYGRALYDATTLTWVEDANISAHPELRAAIYTQKAAQWNSTALAIKVEDPSAYEALQGLNGLDRLGAALVALLSALLFGEFDIAASVVILFGFLIVRFAIINAPLLGTIGIFEPASGGVKRLANAVVSAAINIVFFGAASGIYLWAMVAVFSTSLPGPIQIFVIGLCGFVGLAVLRPAKRLLMSVGRTAPDKGGVVGWVRRTANRAHGGVRAVIPPPEVAKGSKSTRPEASAGGRR